MVNRLRNIISTFVYFLQFHLVQSARAFNDCIEFAKRRNVRKLSVVSCNRLDERPEVGPCYTEDEGPVVLRVEVAVSQNEQTFVRLWSKLIAHYYVKQILCIELLTFCVKSDASLDKLVRLEVLEIQLDWWLMVTPAGKPRKENLDLSYKLVDQ